VGDQISPEFGPALIDADCMADDLGRADCGELGELEYCTFSYGTMTGLTGMRCRLNTAFSKRGTLFTVSNRPDSVSKAGTKWREQ
jgi:hypothetical protein